MATSSLWRAEFLKSLQYSLTNYVRKVQLRVAWGRRNCPGQVFSQWVIPLNYFPTSNIEAESK